MCSPKEVFPSTKSDYLCRLIYFLDKIEEGNSLEMFSETVIVSPLNSPHLSFFFLFTSLSNTHIAAFLFGRSQTVDKASVKWDLAATWTKLAGTVSDIIWKRRPLFCMNRGREGKGGEGWRLQRGSWRRTGRQCGVMIDV